MSIASALGNYILYVLSGLLHAFLVTAAIAEYAFQAISFRTGFAGAVVIISALCAAITFAVVRLCFPRIAIYRPSPYAITKYPSVKDRNGHRVSEHVWVSGDMLLLDHGQGPAYCNSCEALVVQGITCLVCRMVAHEEHHALVDAQPCKRMYDHLVSKLAAEPATSELPTIPDETTSADNKDKSPNEPATKSRTSAPASERHQWIQGNLSIDARCIVCSNSAGSEPTLKDHRCLWCQAAAHTACLPTANATQCNLSPFPNVVVPSRFVVGNSSHIHAKHVVDAKFKVTELPEETRPVLCIVNPSSGAQDSPALLRGLYALVNPVQVADVSRDNPEALLRAFEPHLHRCRILACGGDGTIAWVFSILDKLIPANQPRPPVGVLPLGTGNDLARVLGWGGGWTGEEVKDIVKDIIDAEEVDLDRWKVDVEPVRKVQRRASFVGRVVQMGEKKKEKKSLVMNNYFSMGTDASVALEFHTKRLQKPHYFKSRFINKVFYALIGGKYQFSNLLDIFDKAPAPTAQGAPTQEERTEDPSVDAPSPTSAEPKASSSNTLLPPTSIPSRRPSGAAILSSTVFLNEHKAPVDLTTSTGALIVLNIASYGGGGMIYSPAESEGSPKSLQDDGRVEVMTVNSPAHLGASVLGLTSPTVVGQAKTVRIEVLAPEVAMQVDGEPWQQEGPCTVTISLFGRTKMLKKRESTDEEEEDAESDASDTDADDEYEDDEVDDVASEEGRNPQLRMRGRRKEDEDEGIAIYRDEDEEVPGSVYWR